MASSPWPLTQWDDEEAHVAEPVGCLVRQLLHEEPQDGAEVMLCSRHSDLHRGWWLRIAVAAAIPRGVGQRGTDASLSLFQDHPAEVWEAYDPKVQLLLPHNLKGATNPRMPTNRSSEFMGQKLNVCLDVPGPEGRCSRPLLGQLQEDPLITPQ